MFKFMNSETTIKEASEYTDEIKQFSIVYPKKKGKFIDISSDIFKSILSSTPVYVYIDTSLCFSSPDTSKVQAKELRLMLTDLSIDYKHMLANDTSGRDAILGLIKLGRQEKKCDIMAFMLPLNFNDEDIIKKIIEIGAHILVPFETEFSDELREKIFMNNFEGDEDKIANFRFMTYLTNYITQTSIKTKYLTLEEIKKICIKE